MPSILWFLIILIVVLWLFGNFVVNVGSLIHILLVIAIILVIYYLVTSIRTR